MSKKIHDAKPVWSVRQQGDRVSFSARHITELNDDYKTLTYTIHKYPTSTWLFPSHLMTTPIDKQETDLETLLRVEL